MAPMTNIPGCFLIAPFSMALLLALGGCERIDSWVEGPKATRSAIEAGNPAGANATRELAIRGASAGSGKAGDAAAANPKVADQPHPDDSLIAAKVTAGLAADKNLTALRINVAARDGVVTLRGPAPSVAARARAEEIARNVQGVNSVINQLNVQG